MSYFTYLIGWSTHQKFYYGSRYSKDADPSQLMTTYMTSSEYVKEFIELHGMPDIVEVRRTFDSVDECRQWEMKVLQRMKVVSSDTWLNRSAGPGLPPPPKGVPLSEETRMKQSLALKGRPKSDEWKAKMKAAWEKRRLEKPMTEETRKKMSEAAKNRPSASDELRQKRADNQRGKKHSDETRKKMSESRKKYYEQRI